MWMRGNNDYISVVIYFYILFCFVGVKGEEICFFYILFCFVRVTVKVFFYHGGITTLFSQL